MREALIKAMQRHQIVNIMYLAQSGIITKRRVKITKITGDSFTAFCFTRSAKRTFKIHNVLAVLPILQRESGII
ncbi:transcriptional regulator [Lysinibacillus macroides]|uniref:Transcriptional regulator n=1 Tax=Lysinibacillus macroides TaxID=33935 RepID=A0A0M9DFM7_9BACI|nr:transcriptional regulator [Lysinibacillus macroides]KOY80508.1 transcriptional regulator [Lysinibacillus macroides]